MNNEEALPLEAEIDIASLDPKHKESHMMRRILRAHVRSFYGTQKLRIAIGQRIVTNFKFKMGQRPSKTEDTMDAEAIRFLDSIRKEYKRITDGFTKEPSIRNFRGEEGGMITDYAEYALVQQYEETVDTERQHELRIQKLVTKFPVHQEFLSKVSGCGGVLSAVCLSFLDPYKAKYPSSFWKYAGYDVVPLEKDSATGATIRGEGRGRFKKHQVRRKYIARNGEEEERNSLTFNPFLKTKLYLLADILRRQVVWRDTDEEEYANAPETHRRMKKKENGKVVPQVVSGMGKYRLIYINYKNRLENRPDLHREDWQVRVDDHDPVSFGKDSKKARAYAERQAKKFPDAIIEVCSAGSAMRREMMALRYVTKMFLRDLWKAWRTIEGLEVPPDYATAKLGLDHGGRPDKPAAPSPEDGIWGKNIVYRYDTVPDDKDEEGLSEEEAETIT